MKKLRKRAASFITAIMMMFGFAAWVPETVMKASATQDRTYNFWGGYTLQVTEQMILFLLL